MFRRCISAGALLHRVSCCASQSAAVTSYRSQYSLDKLYPNSSLDAFKTVAANHDGSQRGFSGFIPLDEIEISYSRSSGPGGQNVNKVNTKVEVRFHVPTAKWIEETTKQKLMEMESNRITKDGYLIVSCDKTRKQYLNQAECLDKIRCFIRNAEQPPYQPTEEEVKLMQKRKAKAKEAILREKRAHTLKKQHRQKPSSLE